MTPLALAFLVSLSPLSQDPEAAPAPTDWGRFRGPNGTGVAEGVSLPETLDAEEDLAWRVPMLPGYSSPVLDGDSIYLTASEETRLFTICVDRATGEERWRAPAPEALEEPPRGPNSPVSSTPVVDERGVVCFFDNFGLVAYDRAGKERWRHPLGPFKNPYGMGTSPVPVGGDIVVQCDHDDGSFLVAVDGDTGKERWRTERGGFTHGFSSPVVYRPEEGPAEIVVSGSYRVCGYSAEDGKLLWEVKGMAWQSKSLPVVDGDRVYVHSWMASPSELGAKKLTTPWEEIVAEHDADEDGLLAREEGDALGLSRLWFLYDLDDDGSVDEEEWGFQLARAAAKNGLFAIRLGGRGDVTETHTLWRYNRGLPNIPSPILVGSVLHVLKEGGVFTSIDPEKGEKLVGGRVEGAEDGYFASPVGAGGRILLASNPGRLAIVEAGAEWEVLSVLDLEEDLWATPALAPGQLVVRTQEALYAFRL